MGAWQQPPVLFHVTSVPVKNLLFTLHKPEEEEVSQRAGLGPFTEGISESCL